MQRITIPEIIEDEWFQVDYKPACGYDPEEKIHLDDVTAAFDSIEVTLMYYSYQLRGGKRKKKNEWYRAVQLSKLWRLNFLYRRNMK